MCANHFYHNACICLVFGDSVILANEPAVFQSNLTNWLPKSTGNWRICWQATTENWDVSKFILQCNGKKPSLTIVQVVKSNKKYIFGGYATKAWAGNGKFKVLKSFLNCFCGLALFCQGVRPHFGVLTGDY